MTIDNQTRFIIPLKRAIANTPDEDLEKAFMRGPMAGAHKYTKREFYFSGGKMRWRYWYPDEESRQHGKALHDPHDKHEHKLIHEQKEVHPNLKGQAKLAVEATINAIKGLFGWKGVKAEEVKTAVDMRPGWAARHHEPYVQKEAQTGEGSRSPNARVMKGLELIPDHLKELVSKSQGGYAGMNSLTLSTNAEDPYLAMNPGVCAYANSQSGQIVIGELSVRDPVGEARYGKALTWTEVVAIHEFGHHVHYALENSNKELIRSWQNLSSNDPNRITEYANTNWKEDFAESFSCAMTHPKELALSCPARYEWMRENLLPELAPLKDIESTPDDDLAWWNEKPLTPARRLLNHLRQKEPAKKFHPYYSENDQFYSVTKDGHHVYIRFGPPDKESEAGWERMPATIDPETMLPRYEGGLFTRLRASGAIKEIYDEYGRPLDERQAYFYLGQDDEKTIANAEIAGEGSTPEEYEKKVGPKGKETHELSYKMYVALGANFPDATVEKERKRVEKARKSKGEEGGFLPDRHPWAPVEITPEEFMAKSATFKFGGVREAKEQRWVLKNPDGTTRTYYDPVEGKQKPVLGVRVYEQMNPDGSFTRLRVNETAEFSAGEKINAPQVITRKDPETGETRKITAWRPYQLQPGDPTDPDELAKKFNTTTENLLEANNKFGKGQIMDPVVSTLINPSKKVIRDAKGLQELLRAAAEDSEPRRTWVSIAGAGESVGDQAIGHIQVEWDGAGPPKVVGDYWAKKLGKAEVRIDELLGPNNEIKIERVKERKPKKKPIVPGATVWMMDPKAKRRVMGTFIRRKRDDKGNDVFEVQALPNQGAGLTKTVVAVNPKEVTALTEAEIPGKAGRVRRLVQPLEHDILLYADEVAPGSGPLNPSGVIKILLPKDGSVNREEILRIRGIQETEPDPDQTTKQLTMSITDLPRMREHLGGFVMEGRVNAMLDEAVKMERMKKEYREKADVITDADLVDDTGFIKEDGLLKGLIAGGEGLVPAEHQLRALRKLAKSGGRQLFAHFMGMGKTALAIMSAEMMRNLRDENGNPHPNQVKKKVINVVPLNTAENWYQEYKKWHKELPTLIGSDKLAGAQQLPKLPVRGAKESEGAYKNRILDFWKKELQSKPNLWNPFTDTNQNVVVPFEYFRDNEEALRLTGLFDGMVVDEAHRVGRKNQLSNAVERWQTGMKMFIAMTGTPITNRLDMIPRMIELVSGGMVRLGTPGEFAERWLIPSSVMRAYGAKKAPLTDINPMRVGELAAILQPLMDVAVTSEVKGKAMPSVLLDENAPAHMIGQQARMYRAAMAALTPEDRESLATSSALGLDEQSLLDEDARRKVNVARSVANCPSYKAPDEREYATYKAIKIVRDRKGKPVGTTSVVEEFQLPSYEMLTGNKPSQFRGKWPDQRDVESGRVQQGYLDALYKYFDHIMGVAYEQFAGKKINEKMLRALSRGEWETPTGFKWLKTGGKIPNPDYGPEGMTNRGVLDEATGEIKPLTYQHFDAKSGKYVTKEIPVGWKAIRDPNKKAAGLFYAEDDWDYTGRFKDSGEEEETPPEDEEDEEDKVPGKKGKGQGPKEGRESQSIQRSIDRREEREMFDAIVTHNNAKCDELENWMKNALDSKAGALDPDKAQFVLFGNRVGSSVRTMEAKMRQMGYQDVNEALGHPNVSSPEDKAKRPRKYYVTYMGKGATLGNRNVNSEVFRRKQDQFGQDTGTSMFVWRSLYGTTGKPPAVGEIKEGWGRAERKEIYKQFINGYGKTDKKTGKPLGLEVPMRVMGVKGKPDQNGNPTTEMRYVYESDLSGKEKSMVKDLEVRIRGSKGKEQAKYEAELKAILDNYWTDRQPLTNGDHGTADQIYVFNNTQVMVASDAANVGLNWPAANMAMYDSLFSPMDEWQRIARAARLLPPMLTKELKPLVDKIDASIQQFEKDLGTDPQTHNEASAMELINRAIDKLPPEDKARLHDLPGGAPDQILEAYFAKRAMDRIQAVRKEVGDKLRSEGATPDPTKPRGSDNYIPPAAITEADIMNEVLRNKLTNFEKQMMRGRRLLVEAKRFTTSVDMPVMKKIKVKDPETGKTKTVSVPMTDEDGNIIFEVESPVHAEKSQLAQQRAKMVPYEEYMRIVQHALPARTEYDFVTAAAGSMARFSLLDPNAEIDMEHDHLRNEMISLATELKKNPKQEKIMKSFPMHYVKALRWDHLLPPKPKFFIRG